jgi:site-specific DNA recombinase
MHHQVAARMEGLARLSRTQLRQLWRQEFRRMPPRSLGRDVLALGIAYAWQERTQGGLSARIAKELDRLSTQVLQEKLTPGLLPRRTSALRTGTVLIRKWQGNFHHVTVTADGFVWNAHLYPSLTSVARSITGTRWNGPVSSVCANRRRKAAPAVPPDDRKTFRCAICTRKSSEHGLEQDFNSLDAQREAAEAYIKSQGHEGWRLIKANYDDGGLSGGTMERPALQMLLADVQAGKIDIVVVYKVDRLTRSLADFAKLVELFEAHRVSFVSVTQQFNTTTSMGRLTLNILLSFAQFERAVAGERIRDKFAASRRKGMWMGGTVPLGYDVKGRKLVINASEAATVRLIYQRYLAAGSVHRLRDELEHLGIRSKQRVLTSGRIQGGGSFDRGALYHLLRNRLYRGEVVHRGIAYPGQHESIVNEELWQTAQQLLCNNLVQRRRSRTESGAILSGLIFDNRGNCMTPAYTSRRGVRYRYYASRALLRGDPKQAGSRPRVSADDIEPLIVNAVRHRLDPDASKSAAAPGTWDQETRLLVRETVTRLVVQSDTVEITFRKATDVTSDEIADAQTPAPVLTVPLPSDHSRARREIIVPGPKSEKRYVDEALILALARARSWLLGLTHGDYANTGEIAQRFKLNEAHVRRLIRFAFLASDIVEAIVEGRQRRSLTVKLLLLGIPLVWDEQRRIFGRL